MCASAVLSQQVAEAMDKGKSQKGNRRHSNANNQVCRGTENTELLLTVVRSPKGGLCWGER